MVRASRLGRLSESSCWRCPRWPDSVHARSRCRQSAARSRGDGDLVLWDFHDLLFHTAAPMDGTPIPSGGLYAHADLAAPPPAVRPSWPGRRST
jgi:hypothetical protein